MPRGQAALLCVLVKRDGMTQSEIAEQLSVQGATVTNMLQRLEEAGIAYGRANEPAAVLSHPQAVERGRLRTVHTSARDVAMLAPPFNVDAWPITDPAVPGLGEHTTQVLQELGYTDAEIGSLREQSVVA